MHSHYCKNLNTTRLSSALLQHELERINLEKEKKRLCFAQNLHAEVTAKNRYLQKWVALIF
jgi:hypothetical protein